MDYMITQQERERLRGWFTGRLPDGLYDELLDVTVDREEITVVGRIPEPDLPDAGYSFHTLPSTSCPFVALRKSTTMLARRTRSP